MTLRVLVVALLAAAAAASVAAQGVSEEYARERTRARFERPYGLGIEWDAFAHAPFFEQMHKVRAEGLPGDRIGYNRDMNALPLGVFLDTELRLRFSWHDSIEAGYGFAVLRAFDDRLDETSRFNGVVYPKGTDSDYGADWHEFRLLYRRDLFRLGLDGNFTMYGKVGLEWSMLKVQFGSDTYAVEQDRDEERLRELLPWWNAGLGFELNIGHDWRITAEGRGTYEVGVPTFQKRDGESFKQSIISLTGEAALEYRVTDWFALILRGKYRYFRAKLYGGYRADSFLWWSAGPEFGIGLRF